MNPSKQGWILKYNELLKQEGKSLQKTVQLSPVDRERNFYLKLRYSGMVYGFPVDLIYLDRQHLDNWSEEEALKVLLLEGFLFIEQLFGRTPNIDDQFVNDVSLFYDKSRLAKQPKLRLKLFEKNDPIQNLENILQHRVGMKINLDNKLSYLYNSLLIQDLILFFKLKNGFEEEKLFQRRENILQVLLQTMSVAAHADGEISEQERKIFHTFLVSAQLGDKKSRVLQKFFKSGTNQMSEIDFSLIDSWILKRYLFEIVLLTIWSDNEKSSDEVEFLLSLQQMLGISNEDVEESHLSVDAFIVQNHDRLPFMKSQSDLKRIYANTSIRFGRVLKRNKKKLSQELKESQELVRLISLATWRELTKEEKVQLRHQMKDMIRAVPALTVFMMPGGSIMLPLLVKIIPNIVPSAFRDNQLGEEPDKKEE